VAVCHGLLMFAANQFQLFYLPFAWIYYPVGSIPTFYVGMALQFAYLLDVALNLNTSFLYQRQLVESRWEIARHYTSKWFVLELVSAVPINALVPEPSDAELKALHDYSIALIMLRLLRLLLVDQRLLPTRLFQESKHLVSQFTYSRYAHLLGIAKLVWLVLVVAHYMGCLWHVVAQRGQDVHVGEQYVADFYYAVQLIQGQGSIAGTWREAIYSTFVILIGSGILAIVFGNVAMLVSNFNANTTRYQQKMEAVFATMHKMCLPLKLRERVHQYYAHVWTEYESLDGDIAKFQRKLAHTLGLEVGLFKYMNLVMKIPFWESCSPDFATQIIRNLAVRVYLPDDYVVRKGETGDVLFMLNRGICELSDPEKSQQPKLAILATTATTGQRSETHMGPENAASSSFDSTDDSHDEEATKGEFDAVTRSPKLKGFTTATLLRGSIGKDKRAQVYPSNYEINHEEASSGKADAKKQILLYPGQAFGEMSLLMNYKRTANIRAATYVEICCLDRSSFQRIISRYPEDRRHVLTMMLKNCIEKKEIPFPWDEVVDAVAERRRLKGEAGAARLSVHSAVTSTEAAEALVDRIDINRPDESIKYGFQTFHPDLLGQEAAASKPDTTSTSLRQHTLGRNLSRVNAEKKTRAAQSKTPASQLIEDPRIDGMERMLGTLLNVVTAMAASIERLEKNAEKGATACCKCSPASATEQEGDATATTEKLAGEVRCAEGKPIRLSGRSLLRRSSTSDVLAKMHTAVQDNIASYRQPPPRMKPKERDSMAQSDTLLGSIPVQEPTQTSVPTTLESAAPSAQAEDHTESSADSHHSQDNGLYSIPKQRRGWLTRGTSQSSEPTFADQLWSRHKGTRTPIGELGKSGSDPRRLRARVSTPAIFEGSAAVLRSHREQTNRASQRSPRADHFRAMRRVGVDALTTLANTVSEVPDLPPPLGLQSERTQHQFDDTRRGRH